MKIVYGQPAVLVMLVTMVPLTIGAQSAYAETAYQSGFKHGVSDGKVNPRVNCPGLKQCHWYILEPGKGFQFHTWDFTRGYVIGYCSVTGPHTGFDADQADFDCDKGPTSAGWLTK